MKHFGNPTKAIVAALGLAAMTAPALAQQGLDEPFQKPFKEALAGKTVAYVPVAMNFDLTEGWYAGLKKELEPFGVKFVIRDANWNTNAGAQAVTSLISEKPAVMVVHNPDVQTYAKLLQRAENEGIYVIQINMGSAYRSSALRRRQLGRDRRTPNRRRGQGLRGQVQQDRDHPGCAVGRRERLYAEGRRERARQAS
ncbi:ABC-type sugar transport system substrate-binding protein [Bradyrhizobium sp. i1.3.1]